MKQLITLIFSIGFLSSVLAQTNCTRYQNIIFPNFTETTVTYSTSQGGIAGNLLMDIYTPNGDTYNKRPFVLMAHGGSFTSGDRNADNAVTLTCEALVKRGYVCGSIDYRLTTIGNLLDSLKMIETVMKAVSDSKAALRYMYQNADTWGVDTTRFFIGGNSAGSILAIHEAYLDASDNIPTYIMNKITANGGFEGNSGNPGVTPKIKAVINYAGGISRTEWINTGDAPMISFHGTNDQVVPYNCGNVYASYGIDLVDLCGSNALHSRCNAVSVYNPFTSYQGAGHTPWNTNTTMMNAVIDSTINFLLNYVDCNISGLGSIEGVNNLSVFPNPTSNVLHINLNAESLNNLFINIMDINGRIVYTADAKANNIIELKNFNSGIYTVMLHNTLSGETMQRRIIKQ